MNNKTIDSTRQIINIDNLLLLPLKAVSKIYAWQGLSCSIENKQKLNKIKY